MQVRGIDLAGNVGPDMAPYPFVVEGSSGGTNIVWIIVGAAGGAVLLLVSWQGGQERDGTGLLPAWPQGCWEWLGQPLKCSFPSTTPGSGVEAGAVAALGALQNYCGGGRPWWRNVLLLADNIPAQPVSGCANFRLRLRAVMEAPPNTCTA
jgi:hypothetical protein